MGRQHQGMDRPGVRQVTEGSGEEGKMEETGCEIICGAPNDTRGEGIDDNDDDDDDDDDDDQILGADCVVRLGF